MNFEEPEMDFREVDRRYAELKRRFDAGSISAEEFDGQRLRLMVRDDEGRWGTKVTRPTNVDTSTRTVRGMPPYYQPPSADGALDLRLQLEQTGPFPSWRRVRDERSPSSRPEQGEQVAPQAVPDSPSTRDRSGGGADAAAPILESELREALRKTKRLGER